MELFSQVSEQYTGKGRVLRVKEGFNPNSSSLGSIVFSMHTTLMAAPLILAGAAAWIASRMACADLPGRASAASETEEEK
jgi:hypothetical protein